MREMYEQWAGPVFVADFREVGLVRLTLTLTRPGRLF